MDGSLNLCTPGTGKEQDWQSLYESSFPAGERSPKEELIRLLEAGTILLHRTTNKNDELLCFSIVNPMSNFALLSYIATDQTKRSSGVGTKHMRKLIEIIKAQYPHYLGLVLEIESTKEKGLDDNQKTARHRRLAFYQRLGAKRLCKTYVWPSYAHKGAYNLAELLWFDFDPATIYDDDLPGIIRELYLKGYGVAKDDPILELVVHQFLCPQRTKKKRQASICPAEEAMSSQSGATPAVTDASSTASGDAAAVTDDPQTASGDGKHNHGRIARSRFKRSGKPSAR